MQTTSEIDAIEIYRGLTIGQLEARLRDLKSEEAGLLTLLRSLKARERAKRRMEPNRGPTNA